MVVQNDGDAGDLLVADTGGVFRSPDQKGTLRRKENTAGGCAYVRLYCNRVARLDFGFKKFT